MRAGGAARRRAEAARSEPAWLAQPGDSDGNSALVFTRAGPEFVVEPGIAGQRIGYRLRDGTLELVYWPALDNAGRRAAPRRIRWSAASAHFRVRALGARPPLGATLAACPATSPLPRAVRVALTLDDGTRVERVVRAAMSAAPAARAAARRSSSRC